MTSAQFHIDSSWLSLEGLHQYLTEHNNIWAPNDWRLDILDFLEKWQNDSQEITVNTSGTTGNSKPIQLSKKAMITSAEMTINYLNLQAEDTALLCLSARYIAGKMMLVRAIVGHMRLILEAPSAEGLPLDQPIDFCALTPMQVEKNLNRNPNSLDQIKQLIIGGAPINHTLRNRILELKTTCYATFGMTETITHIALQPITKSNSEGIYEALANVTFSVDKDGNLIIEAAHLDSPVRTKDVVNLISSTQFIWKGRSDNVINSGGVKIHPEEIERKIQALIGDHEYFIDSLPDESLGQKCVLWIAATKQSYDPDQLLMKLKAFLPTYQNPKEIVFVPAFVRTETGKIKRKETAQKFA